MPQDGYGSVSAPEDKIEQASDYKPDGATWGEVLVAGAERLNENLDSDRAAVSEDIDAAALVALEDRLDEVAEMLEKIQNDWEYLNGEEIHGGVHESGHQLREALEQLDQLDRIEDAATTAEARTGSIENTLDDMGAGR